MATQVKTVTPAFKTLRYLPGSPLVGNLFEFRKDRLEFALRMARTGDVCGMHFGPFPDISLIDQSMFRVFWSSMPMTSIRAYLSIVPFAL